MPEKPNILLVHGAWGDAPRIGGTSFLSCMKRDTGSSECKTV